MNRIKAPCHCCGAQVEMYRDQISGPDHYRCGNCFELYGETEMDSLRDLHDELTKIEEMKHAAIAAHGFGRR